MGIKIQQTQIDTWVGENKKKFICRKTFPWDEGGGGSIKQNLTNFLIQGFRATQDSINE